MKPVAAQHEAHAAGRLVRIAAPAKVNLYLHVLGRRPDGMHLLDSLIVFAGCGDTLEAASAEALSLAIDGPFAAGLPADGDNLVLRAATRLAAAAEARGWPRRTKGAVLRLTKRLPVASGIGGGSTDAAAALLALAALWGLPADAARLHAVGLEVGADVPVCLERAPRFVGGIGERLDRVPPLPPAWLVLANPDVPVSTAAVFKSRSAVYSAPARWDDAIGDAATLARRLAARGNDLAAAATALAPAIGAVLAALAAQPGCLLARLSGSGATCFGLFAAAGAAQAAAATIARSEPAWWVRAARLLRSADEVEAEVAAGA
jgi:4-diphosphocytidyl-2-C-methyl-D-erythritol kinase